MAEYFVELYLAQGDRDAAQRHAASAAPACTELTDAGRPVRCVRSIFVPEDETHYLLYEAHSTDLVAEALHRAGLPFEHISEATSTNHLKGITMTTQQTPQTIDLAELRDKQQKVWSSGDYNRIAALTVPVSEHLVERAGIFPGERVLDVATGTGHVALAAARRGAVATGMDYVPALLDIARRRATAEDLAIDLRRRRRRGPAVRRRLVRRRPVGHRRDVRRRSRLGPPTSWSACDRAGWTDRAGQLDSRGLRRPACSRPSAATWPRRRRPSRPRGGASRRSSPSCSAPESSTCGPSTARRTAAVRLRRGASPTSSWPTTGPTYAAARPSRRGRPGARCEAPWSTWPTRHNTNTVPDTRAGVVCDWQYRVVTARTEGLT